MYIKKYVNIIKAEPLVFIVGLCVLLIAVMGTSVRHLSSTMFTILFLLSITVIKDWFKLYVSLSKLEKTFLLAFFLYTISFILSFYNVDDFEKYYKLFERYLRFTLIIPVYLLIIKINISLINYLFLGATISGPFLFAVALHHYIDDPNVPAQGYYHHIIFGQLAMLNVGIMLSLLLARSLSRQHQALILISMLCGVLTAVMSQARGVWLVFPIYIMIAIYYALGEKRISTRNIAAFLVAVILLSLITPIGDLIKQRTDLAITEVTRFYTEDQYVSSVGTRLAMWDIAINVWKQNPILGTGPGDFDDEIVMLQNQGKYTGMDIHNSAHNIYIQALVGSGIVGLLALVFAIIIMPLKLLFNESNFNKEGSMAGFVTIISFAVYGISESWTLRLPAISIFHVYIIVIISHMQISSSNNKC